jgi:predicted tellurium resistance membrane protein TerC
MLNLGLPIATAAIVLPMLWLVFWLADAERRARTSRIAGYAILGFVGVTAIAVILTFSLERDPLCMHIPKGYDSWPCGVAQHMSWPADDAPHQGLLRTEVRPLVTFF